MPCRCPHPGGLEQLEGEGVGVCIRLDEGGGARGGGSASGWTRSCHTTVLSGHGASLGADSHPFHRKRRLAWRSFLFVLSLL